MINPYDKKVPNNPYGKSLNIPFVLLLLLLLVMMLS